MKLFLATWLRENWLVTLVVLFLAGGYLVLNQKPSQMGGSEEFIQSLAQGKPTVLSFYSNF